MSEVEVKKRGRPRKVVQVDSSGIQIKDLRKTVNVVLPWGQYDFLNKMMKCSDTSSNELFRDVLHILEHYAQHNPQMLSHFLQPVIYNKYFKDLNFYVESK